MSTVPEKSSAVSHGRSPLRGRDREFLPAALEILETPPAAIPVVLGRVICAFVVVALLWSFFGRLDVVSMASGKIDIEGHAKIIQPLEPGKVVDIRVENGSHVKKGDLLLALDDVEAIADEAGRLKDFVAANSEVVRRQHAIDIAHDLDDSKTSGPVTSIDIVWHYDVPAFVRLREQAILQADISQLKDALNNISKQVAQKEATRQRLDMSISVEEDLMKTLSDRVHVREASIKLLVGTKINLFDAVETLKKSETTLAGDKGELIETEAAITELKSEQAKVISQFIADNQSKLGDASRKADDFQEDLAKARAKLARVKFYSPIDGVVQQLAVTTVGQVVTTGQQLMLVGPEGRPLIIDALVSNQDIGFIKLGQEVAVKVDAFNFTRFGTLHGKVVRIAADAMDEQDAKRNQASATALASGGGNTSSPAAGQPQSFVFPVVISLEEKSVRVGSVDVPLTPGMTVVSEIKTDSRRIIDYLMSPIAKMSSEAMKER